MGGPGADTLNPVRVRLAHQLHKAAGANKAPIWERLSREALKPGSARRTVNVKKLAQLTSGGQTVAVPGKVLGTGTISHPISLFSFSISEAAARKVAAAGGRLLSGAEAVEASPSGKDVLLIG